jgi:hypothetical protein
VVELVWAPVSMFRVSMTLPRVSGMKSVFTPPRFSHSTWPSTVVYLTAIGI